MKITSFNPLIVTKDADAAVALFEALGFKRAHSISAVENNGTEIKNVTLRNAEGFSVDVSEAPVPQDIPLIRMNVDNFDEALAFLAERGFKNVKGTDETLDTGTNRSAMMVSPSGFAFDLCQHIKD
ncbi:MAG: VOC family protein [Oscillospiraceae bacterium]|nr:VOC family protein [Oscillospiraceae bacterium]